MRRAAAQMVELLNTFTGAFAAACILSVLWVPWILYANIPVSLGPGEVQSSVSASRTVVRLDSGEFVAVDSLDAPAGSTVEVFTSTFSGPSDDVGWPLAYFITGFLMLAGVAVSALVLSVLHSPLKALHRRLSV